MGVHIGEEVGGRTAGTDISNLLPLAVEQGVNQGASDQPVYVVADGGDELLENEVGGFKLVRQPVIGSGSDDAYMLLLGGGNQSQNLPVDLRIGHGSSTYRSRFTKMSN